MKDLILHEAESRLGARHYLFLKTVHCDYEDGVLTMHGKVPSYYLKQTAQTIVQSVDGIDRVENELSVVAPHGVSSEPVLA